MRPIWVLVLKGLSLLFVYPVVILIAEQKTLLRVYVDKGGSEGVNGQVPFVILVKRVCEISTYLDEFLIITLNLP